MLPMLRLLQQGENGVVVGGGWRSCGNGIVYSLKCKLKSWYLHVMSRKFWDSGFFYTSI
jgi:hypothetical protein